MWLRVLFVVNRSKSWGLGALAASIVLLSGLPTAAAGELEPSPVVTMHSITIGGKRLNYVAEVGRESIVDAASGRVLAHMFFVAYRVPGISRRPITFMWNGGPGLPAASVHFEGFGPRRVEHGVLVDNADTLLTDSDLVFVDPIGTGYSRAVDDQALKQFITTVGDVDAAIEFVRTYLTRNRAEQRPLIISGQSFGAGRAGSAAFGLLKRGFDVRGIALVSNSQGLPRYPDQELIAPAIHVADYAVAALYFGRLPSKFGRTAEAARSNAERWVHKTYLPQLRRREKLSGPEREALAKQLARRTGLNLADIDRKKLTIGQGYFLGHIVPGKMPYYSDYRYFSPYVKPSIAPGIRSLGTDLGYISTLPYVPDEPAEIGFLPLGSLPMSINARWRPTTVADATDAQIEQAQAEYAKRDQIGAGSYGPPLPGAAEAIALSPKVSVVIQHGAYDPLGGCSVDAEHVRQIHGRGAAAVTAFCYASGHAIYRDAPARAEYVSDLRRLARKIAETKQ